jgi:uncharacterized DUF497 family protein
MIFEWDQNKNIINKQKHGISFEEAILIFTDRDALSIYDDEHSCREDRWVTIGLIPAGKIVVVVHTDRVYIDEKEVIRIISARKASEKEIRDYYNLNKR